MAGGAIPVGVLALDLISNFLLDNSLGLQPAKLPPPMPDPSSIPFTGLVSSYSTQLPATGAN